MSTISPSAPADADVFEAEFVDAPDLDQLSPAARRVLATAAALFHDHGAAATSVRDITGACGLSPGALYKHFGSKDDVLYELVRHGHERLERRVADALAQVDRDDPVGRTAAFVRAYVVGHLLHPALAQVVRREYLHLSPERYRHTVRRRRRLRSRLAALLQEGVDAGVLDLPPGAATPVRVAVMMLDMCSRTSDWYHPGRAGSPERLADLYVAGALRLAGAVVPPTA